jgi:hypothetical protein
MVEGEWRALDIEGDSMVQHSELFALANSKVTFDDSELYVFEGEEHEGLGGLTARVVDGCIVETRLWIYEW